MTSFFTVTPQLTISPTTLRVRAGASIHLTCKPATPTSGRYQIEWIKEGGSMNPAARESNGVLHIPRATRADSGTYRCSTGTTEARADVVIVGKKLKIITLSSFIRINKRYTNQ